MKQFSSVLNIILPIAVAVLFYFHFKEKKTAPAASSMISSGTPIVFINSDSLTEKYQMYIQRRAELQSQQDRIKQMLKDDGERFQSQLEDYQKKAPQLSKVERDATEKRLGELQQQLMQKRDQMTAELEDKKDRTNEEIYNHLTAFVKDYLKKKGLNYNFVLGYQKGGGIIYAKDSLDITHEIVEGLNNEYKNENPLGK